MTFCEKCGMDVPAGKRFCTGCGAAVALLADPDRSPDPCVPAENNGEFLHWTRKIPLITNPYLVLQCILIPVGIALVTGGFFTLISGTADMLVLFLLISAGLAILMLVVMLVLQIVTGGGLETEFFISNEGVAHKAGSTTRALNRASAGGSVVLGSLSGTGAGMLAISQENSLLPWADVRYVSVYRSMRSIVFRTKYLIGPVVLYCSEENFLPVLAMVKKYALPAAKDNL